VKLKWPDPADSHLDSVFAAADVRKQIRADVAASALNERSNAMPQRTHRFGKSLTKHLFLAAALSLLSAMVRRERRQLLLTARARTRKIRVGRRRVAASLAFATLFFAGAALSAGAGNSVVQLIDPSADSLASDATTSTSTTDTVPAVEPPAADGSLAEPSAQPAEEAAPAEDLKAEAGPSEQAPPAADPAPAANVSSSAVQAQLKKRARAHPGADGSAAPLAPQGEKQHGNRSNGFHGAPPVLKTLPVAISRQLEREPEADEPGVASTIWLHRTLPDPTPPSRRLSPAFAKRLARVSARNHVDWALTLAVLRASGELGAAPASPARLKSLAKQLKALKARRNAWTTVLALEGRTTFADRTVALQQLYHAVGLKALVRGFEWSKPSLSRRILHDSRISIYPGGRADIEAGRVNVRVLALIAYLAEAHGQVTISCLISGHRLYARPGVVSAHIYGLAADISSLSGTSIFGHQQPGSVTEHAVRNILLLPAELQPRQVISLIGMGGPSFPLANHDDHIHVGY